MGNKVEMRMKKENGEYSGDHDEEQLLKAGIMEGLLHSSPPVDALGQSRVEWHKRCSDSLPQNGHPSQSSNNLSQNYMYQSCHGIRNVRQRVGQDNSFMQSGIATQYVSCTDVASFDQGFGYLQSEENHASINSSEAADGSQ